MVLTFEQQCALHTFAVAQWLPAGLASSQRPPALAALQKARFAALGTASLELSSDFAT